jgi:hypothetical protein
MSLRLNEERVAHHDAIAGFFEITAAVRTVHTVSLGPRKVATADMFGLNLTCGFENSIRTLILEASALPVYPMTRAWPFKTSPG